MPMSATATTVTVCPVDGLPGGGGGGPGVGVGAGAVGGESGGVVGGVFSAGGGAEAMDPPVVVGCVGVCGDLLQAATVASRTSAEMAEMWRTRTEGNRRLLW